MQTVFTRAGLRCSLFAVLMAGSLLIAQDKKTETKTATAAAKSKNRLPANYGKLNLAKDQKTKIYGIQASYDPKIEDLTAQLKALREKEQTELEAVLTPDQLKQLNTLKAEAKKKLEDAKAAKASTAEKKPESTTVTTETKKAEPVKKP